DSALQDTQVLEKAHPQPLGGLGSSGPVPGEALVGSQTLREALEVMLKLLRSENGVSSLDAVVDRAIAQLKAGVVNWEELLGDKALAWEKTTGLPVSEVETRCRAALRLLTTGNNQAEEVQVSSGEGLTFDGTWLGPAAGRTVAFRVARSPTDQLWGQWPSHYVVEGPAALLGHRLVACKRGSGGNVFTSSGELSVKTGDSLYLANADRAAILEMATYDQLPEFAGMLAQLLREGQTPADEIQAPPEMMEAARFTNDLELINE
ncbi:unnamed protein product, partial [Polarella glacialis]